MTDRITVTGVVGSDPRPTMTPAGLQITNFRLASTRRYFDRATGQWTDGETNWYSVSTFRQLALNTAESVRKGQHVVVHGRLRVRPRPRHRPEQPGRHRGVQKPASIHTSSRVRWRQEYRGRRPMEPAVDRLRPRC